MASTWTACEIIRNGQKKEPKESENTTESPFDDAVREVKQVEYIATVNGYILKGNHKSAYAVIQRAAVMYLDDSFVISFYGRLQAIVGKKHRRGVDNCTKAIAMVQRRAGTIDRELLFPGLYLNLGKTYVAAGKKKNAVAAFHQSFTITLSMAVSINNCKNWEQGENRLSLFMTGQILLISILVRS